MKDTEQVEKFLDQVTPPACESADHRNRLRSQVLDELAGRRSGPVPNRAWKIAALVGGLLCAGALVAQVAVQVQHYIFQGRTRDGAYEFSTEPRTVYQGAGVTVSQTKVTTVGADESGAVDVEQMRKDLEEMDALRQQNAREITGVTDTQVNGHALGRVFSVKYVLADGRVKTMNEGGLESRGNPTPAQIESDHEQIAQLRQQGLREVTTVIETELNGQIDRTLICRYVLSDGREVTLGEGDPSLPHPTARLSPAQSHELMRLGREKAGTFIDTVKKQLFGREFTLERYSYTLSDGTVALRSEGQPSGLKRTLNEADWNELHEQARADGGEVLGRFDQEVDGRLFSFETRRYVLSDGTEVIRSRGRPKTAE